MAVHYMYIHVVSNDLACKRRIDWNNPGVPDPPAARPTVTPKSAIASVTLALSATARGAHMQEFEGIKVLFVAGFGSIVRDRIGVQRLYGEALNFLIQ
jgi:hypothetical protein